MASLRLAWTAALVVAALGLLAARPAVARTVHVSATAGDDAGGDGSPARPWRTLTHALAPAQGLTEGDEVLVGPGTHDLALGEVFPIDVAQGVSIHGDPAGGTRLRLGSVPMPPFPAALLRPRVGTAVIALPSVIDHLVLEGPGPGSATAGVLFVPDKGAGPVLKGCRISGFGRAVGSDLVLVNGPARVRTDSRPFVDGNWLHGNGIGIDILVSITTTPGDVRERTEIVNNWLYDNSTGIRVRAFCQGCDLAGLDAGNAILNNTFAANSGDALRLENSDCSFQFSTNSPQVQNNVFAFHTGRALAPDACSVPNTVDTNVFWQNAPGGDGDPLLNLMVDPLLVDVARRDLHLSAASPCIDRAVGQPDVLDDIDGDSRPQDGDGNGAAAWDIGADEYVPSPGLELRRANFLSLAPPTPSKPSVFPMFPANPLTTLVTPSLAPGDTDVAGLLGNTAIPMAFYQHSGGAAPALLCTKNRSLDTVAFDLR